jgi:hypothetical protein
MRTHFVVFLLVFVFASFVNLPSHNLFNTAKELTGGQGPCFDVIPRQCPFQTYGCGTIPCVATGVILTSWNCPSGTYEQQAYGNYLACAATSQGRDECFTTHKFMQLCGTRRSCSNSCALAVGGPNAGSRFCGAATGMTWNINAIPLPSLGPNFCPWFEDPWLS